MGKVVKVLGWFFGVLIFIFGLMIFFITLLRLGDATAPLVDGLVKMPIGALACYGGSRSVRKKLIGYHADDRSITMNLEQMQAEAMEKEKKRREIMEHAKKHWVTDQNQKRAGPPIAFFA